LPEVEAHSNYFTRGSAALGNMADVVMGRYDHLVPHRSTLAGAVGNLVATLMKAPFLPVAVLARHYSGPGFRLVRVVDRGVHMAATESGEVVRDGLKTMAFVGGRVVGLTRR
ncbi:MAG TPA: hypothetical protein VMU09_04680, partial [Acidimicrobiales bacterium]|nr:hypothetical protein [Acidimicrobiales bacterium]